MFFIPLPIVLTEILVFTTFVHFFDFWDVFLAYLLPSFFGAVLFSLTGRSMMMAVQGGMMQGQLPADRVLHKGALLLGSILLIIPTFLSRVLAVLLIVPIFRHISVYIFKNFIFKRMKNSSFSFAQFGGFQQGPRHQRYQGPFPFAEGPRQERDVDAVDITPLEITHTKITDDGSNSEDPNKRK